MSDKADLAKYEVSCLEMVRNGKYLNVASVSNEVEALVAHGYVSKSALVGMPLMQSRYDYVLSIQGLIALRQHKY
ncbi:hypothetical protein [Methylotenera sp. L2L1]|uniref:hypothetical protein n=1 Tax=Methylotenera sp. L2L1 TaxID=1502770 RepID=UPI0005681FE1|nr:hypothetical protein [Methylotenera sp. L2L1]